MSSQSVFSSSDFGASVSMFFSWNWSLRSHSISRFSCRISLRMLLATTCSFFSAAWPSMKMSLRWTLLMCLRRSCIVLTVLSAALFPVRRQIAHTGQTAQQDSMVVGAGSVGTEREQLHTFRVGRAFSPPPEWHRLAVV
jgi:hypothetical protein